MKAELETLFPGQFEFTEERAYFDYIYLRESLVELKGKKLHGKKNHLNAFKNTYPDWKFEHITSENIDECWQMNAGVEPPERDVVGQRTAQGKNRAENSV